MNNDITNFINSTTIGTIFLDSNLCVRKFTPAVTKEINLIDQDVGRPISHISHNLRDEDLVRTAREVMDSLVPAEREVRTVNNRWYIIKYSPYRTSENIIKGIVISLVDITKRKEAEENLRKSKERYEKLVALSPFAIFIIRNDLIQFSNTEGLNMLQVKSLEHILEKPINKYLDIDETRLVIKQKEYSQSNDNIVMTMEDKIIRADGSVVYVEIMSMPVTFDDGPAQMVILRDVSYRKLSEQLREENMNSKRLLDEALAFEKVKNDFFGNLSHELRTPLTVIMSTLQLLESKMKNNLRSDKDSTMRKYMNIMKQNCYRQLRMVSNIIDITKMDSGFFDVRKQNHNIVNVVENITLSVSEYIKYKSIDLLFDTDTEEKIIACDPDSIERVMLNLLSNAVKFTNEGGAINVNMYDRDQTILICVKDSGIGIPAEKQDIIFERFRQVDKSLTRNHEGSGIGLSLVKSLVEMHDGTITIQSEYGKGTEFLIELPVKTVPEDERAAREESKLQCNVEKIFLEFSDIYNMN